MQFSCYLVGEDSLLIQCANILLNNHHLIECVISPNPDVKDWATRHNIFYAKDIFELTKNNIRKVDYIFSIVNSYIISPEIMDLARYDVINYHDSLLPKYAGLNATTWAIINAEKEHGVTWHIVNDKIDAGDIVKQEKVPIFEEDTAFSLNLRCYEHAIKSFSALVFDIESKNMTLYKQALENRSYYGLGHALPNFGFIAWQVFSAEFILRLHRALTSDHYKNHVGSLKIHLNGDYLIPMNMSVSPIECGTVAPGTVLAIDEQAIYIATVNHALEIKKFLSKNGEIFCVEKVIHKFGIKVGYRFPELKKTSLNAINRLYSILLKHEKYWVTQIEDIHEHTLFFNNPNAHLSKKLEKSHTISLKRLNTFNQNKLKKIATAAILTYLHRLNNYEKFSVFLAHKKHKRLSKFYGNLFSLFIPLTVEWSNKISLRGVLRYVGKHIKILEKNKTFFTDLAVRHPALKTISIESGVFVNFFEKINPAQLPESTVLYFEYEQKTNELHIYHRFDTNNHFCELNELIHHMPAHISNIVHTMLDNSHAHVNAFCFLTDKERNRLLNDLGKGVEQTIPETSITAIFEAQVFRRPNAPALLMGDHVISYRQLWEQSECMAHFIESQCIKPQTLIGIYIERSVEMFAIILGILKAGCVYVPLDTRYPMLKIEMITEIAGLTAIMSAEKYLDTLKLHFSENQSVKIYSVQGAQLSQYHSIQNLKHRQNQVQKLAYVMFTSGTTGDPKGVMITQSNVINYCTWFCETTQFNENSKVDFSSSIAFDLSVPCTIAPLLVGGQIAICNEATKTDPKRYLQYMIAHQISHVELTPGYLEMLLHYPELVEQLTDLKVLLLGADTLPISDVVKWAKLCPSHQIVNEYGPTEATVSATSHFVGKNVTSYHSSVPIGKPAFNTTCYILDKYSNVCPLGMKGELYIGGAQVANGYIGKPMLTQERFIAASFNDVQDVIYKTGDLVSWLPDGNLQFFGRNDFQVKIQGYRIEITGIESVLLKLPSVQQTAVIVKSGHFKNKYLCAYIVVDKDPPTSNDIKSFLLSHLPSYMVPKEFYVTHSIPLKQNEKIDYKALETQHSELLVFDYDVNVDLDEHEQNIIKIWQTAFHDNHIKICDDFFDLGGNSLIALHIISELNSLYNIEIPLFYLFEYPTITMLAEKIKKLIMPISEQYHEPQLRSVIKLSDHSNGIPLFLIHPVGGSVFWYKQLAKHINNKYSVFGIQDISIDGDDLRFESLEDMAQYYLHQISHIYKGDNYCIGGASFGATVAFEMAHQIVRAGKTVSFLGFFDGWAAYPEELMNQHSSNLLLYKDSTLSASEQKKTDYFEQLENYRRNLLMNYKLKPLKSGAVLFKASELWQSFHAIDDPYNLWKPFILDNLEVHHTPGNHETIFFDPNVQKLGEIISKG